MRVLCHFIEREKKCVHGTTFFYLKQHRVDARDSYHSTGLCSARAIIIIIFFSSSVRHLASDDNKMNEKTERDRLGTVKGEQKKNEIENARWRRKRGGGRTIIMILKKSFIRTVWKMIIGVCTQLCKLPILDREF